MALEIFGVIIGIAYVLLEIKQTKWVWVVGAVTAIIYIIVFLQSKLYAAMGLQCYYFIVSIYGWCSWSREKNKMEGDGKSGIFIKKLTKKAVVYGALIGLACYFVLSIVLSEYTGDPMPKMDSIVTSLSIVGTLWLTKGYLEQWYLWIVANIVAVILYSTQALYPTVILYVVYTIAAIVGLLHWRKNGTVLK